MRRVAQLALMSVVAVAAAWMSFSALTGLARLAHIWPPYLLPVAVDAYAVAATVTWLASPKGTAVRRWSAANSLGAILTSIAGNSAYHGLTEAGVEHLSWVLAAAVAAVAPLALWLVIHLHGLVTTSNPPGAAKTGPETPTRHPNPGTAPAAPKARQRRTHRKPTPSTGKTAAARTHAAAELAAGRALTGGQLARQFAIDPSLGRRIMRELATATNGNRAHTDGHAQ